MKVNDYQQYYTVLSVDELVNLDIMQPGIAAQVDRTRWAVMEMRGID